MLTRYVQHRAAQWENPLPDTNREDTQDTGSNLQKYKNTKKYRLKTRKRCPSFQELAHRLTGEDGLIPMYVMTSEHTKGPTQEFFRYFVPVLFGIVFSFSFQKEQLLWDERGTADHL